ncbi:MAG TPA: tetratricopeptide repeat protein [Candidatus Acidoferrales bacterium]|nr:tetratricopeptide repeat protein [Candidatus Acidoferrales bacterium]
MKRACQCAILCVALFAVASAALSATPDDCQALRKHGHRAEAEACYQTLTETRDPYLRAEGYWGLGMYADANNEFRAAVAQSDSNAMYRVRWGLLLHERFNNTDAEGLFKEALQRDPKNAQAYLGLALVSEDGYDNNAIAWASKALELDPKLVAAHELLAEIALEDSDTNQAIAQADAAIQLSPDALDAMAVHAAIEVLADRPPDPWFAKIAQVNPTYGEAYAIVARNLVLHNRYEDAVADYRKAIELDPQLWSARSELGINLMRLGQEDEPRQQLEMCYDNGYRDEATVNTLRLLDSYKNFVVFRDDTTILKLNKKEADLLHPYVEEILKRAMATYEKKYKMKLPGPVQVEVYPDHEDFAVRTTGMPGLGALGVTFGEVVAMDSPSGRQPGDFNWASTLWHEMSHVYILTATNHRVARWFTEGLAVHEETQASPEWGDPITPDIVAALRDKKLLPVADLDRGFIRPEYPSQVIVSYYQAGRICDYIQERWGADKLLDMVHSYAALKTTPEVIHENLGMTPEEFDKEFQAWLYKGVQPVIDNFDKWREGLKNLAQASKDNNYDEVLKDGDAVLQMYPQYIYAANAYEFIAAADLAKGNKSAAATVLTEYEKQGGRDPDTLKQLATLEEGLGEPKEAAATLDRINWIYPMDEDLHRRLGQLWFAQSDYPGAIREYSAVVAMHPLDRASAEFDLAQAYFAAGQKDKAEDNVLQALEAAPDYRPAQKLLLQLQGSEKDEKGK